MNKASLRDVPAAELNGRSVLVRADLNVPLGAGQITDDTRIRETLPTLRLLKEQGARTVVVSHLGRPKGPDPASSLRPAADRLREIMGADVRFQPALTGPDVRKAV